ncbi:hypothetical protein FRC04_006124 [Tulasnella sp. 424]|nr:hypothetical protein FRC04_006124 [Tulasnella sp. 424]KAG8972243.1 hypothetical protein FRC05_010186 [Tulasnella sp. 425]
MSMPWLLNFRRTDGISAMDAAEKFPGTRWTVNIAQPPDTACASSVQKWIVQHFGTIVGREALRTSSEWLTSNLLRFKQYVTLEGKGGTIYGLYPE